MAIEAYMDDASCPKLPWAPQEASGSRSITVVLCLHLWAWWLLDAGLVERGKAPPVRGASAHAGS